MGILYRGTYSRNGKESTNVYAIDKQTSAENYSSLLQVWDFSFYDFPSTYRTYLGFQTQRLNSFPPFSILVEQIFCTVTDEQEKVVGNVLGQITYPDKGTSDVSSKGTATYRVYSSSGIFRSVQWIKIQFNEDLTREVVFGGSC